MCRLSSMKKAQSKAGSDKISNKLIYFAGNVPVLSSNHIRIMVGAYWRSHKLTEEEVKAIMEKVVDDLELFVVCSIGSVLKKPIEDDGGVSIIDVKTLTPIDFDSHA